MTPDGQYHADEFIGEVISIGRLTRLDIQMPVDPVDLLSAPRDGAAAAIAIAYLRDPGDNYRTEHVFTGHGRTMGFALAEARQQIRDHFGR